MFPNLVASSMMACRSLRLYISSSSSWKTLLMWCASSMRKEMFRIACFFSSAESRFQTLTIAWWVLMAVRRPSLRSVRTSSRRNSRSRLPVSGFFSHRLCATLQRDSWSFPGRVNSRLVVPEETVVDVVLGNEDELLVPGVLDVRLRQHDLRRGSCRSRPVPGTPRVAPVSGVGRLRLAKVSIVRCSSFEVLSLKIRSVCRHTSTMSRDERSMSD